MFQHTQKKRTRRARHLGFFMGLLSIFLLLQACGTAASPEQAAKSGAPAADAKAQVPTVFNYGYIGTNKLNFPGGAEGWGLYKGIIQDELKKHGITEVKLTAFPNGPDQSESLISGYSSNSCPFHRSQNETDHTGRDR
jgi:sulfonate transport system substrate-binding protein